MSVENLTQQSGSKSAEFSSEGAFEWQADSLCAEVGPEVFFPEGSNSPLDAKIICAMCDVAEKCLAYALQSEDQFGISGGLTHRERLKHKKAKPSPAEIHAIVERERAATVRKARAKGRTVILAT